MESVAKDTHADHLLKFYADVKTENGKGIQAVIHRTMTASPYSHLRLLSHPLCGAISIDLIGVKLLTCFRQGKWVGWPGNATGAPVHTAR